MKRLETRITPEGGSQVSWSSLSQYDTCPLAWFYAKVLPHPKGGHGVAERPSRNLVIGKLVHAGLAGWLVAGFDADSGVAALEKAAETEDTCDVFEWTEDARQLFVRYAAECGPGGVDPDSERYTVAMDTDGAPVVEKDYTVDLGYNGYKFLAQIDAVAWDVLTEGVLLIVEHKTCDVSRVAMSCRDYQVSGQLSGYMLAVQAAYPGHPVLPVINMVKKRAAARGTSRHWEPVPRSTHDLEKFRNDVIRRLSRMDKDVAEYQDLVSRGVDPMDAGNMVFDGSPKVGTCSGCPFYEACYRRSTRRQWLATTEPRFPEEVSK